MNTVILDNLYRNGEPVKMMIRNGEVIYQGVTKTEPEPPVPDGQ